MGKQCLRIYWELGKEGIYHCAVLFIWNCCKTKWWFVKLFIFPNDLKDIPLVNLAGTFFWDYSVDPYSDIRITEHTEYQFPKEQTLCFPENRKLRRWNRGSLGTPFSRGKMDENCQKNTNRYSVCSINSAIDVILFRSFPNQNRSQKNTITSNSVYSHSGIVPKERAHNISSYWRIASIFLKNIRKCSSRNLKGKITA